MDLLSILPGFSTKPYSHILPSLEKKHISTVDLITLDTLEIAKRAHVPPADVRRLSAHVVETLHRDLGFERGETEKATSGDADINTGSGDESAFRPGPSTKLDFSRWRVISTLDRALDALLDGGIPTGYVTEVTGESGSGKTQFLLNLLLAVQLPRPHGLRKRAIYISTEAPLATRRLSQLIESHPYLSTLPADSSPSLENVLSITAIDLETQDHILNYQLPVAISRYNVGLVVIDSIAANYRAEHSSHSMLGLSTRSGELAKLGQMLRNLAVKENIAIVVANQVSDRFDSLDDHHRMRLGQVSNPMRDSGGASPLSRSRLEGGNAEVSHPGMIPSSSPAIPSSPYVDEENADGSYLVGNPVRNEILSLARQQRFFTGWGDIPQSPWDQEVTYPTPSNKIPALGFVWSAQIACRIALKKEDEGPSVDIAGLSQTVPGSTPSAQLRSAYARDAATEKSIQRENLSTEPGGTDTEEDRKEIATQGEDPRLPPSSQATERITRRRMKLVFAPWTAGAASSKEPGDEETRRGQIRDEVEFEIWKGGIRSLHGR